MNRSGFKWVRGVASMVGVVGLLGLVAGNCSGPSVPYTGQVWTCHCISGDNGVDTAQPVCATSESDAESRCDDICGGSAQNQGKATMGETCTGSMPAGYRPNIGLPNAVDATISRTASSAGITYYGSSASPLVHGTVQFTGGCESGTCSISINQFNLTSSNFSVVETNSTTTNVTNVNITNVGTMVGTEVNGVITIPSTQINLLVNGDIAGVHQAVELTPTQDVTGRYVPSTGAFSLSASFTSGTNLGLVLSLVSGSISRPPVANAGAAQTVVLRPTDSSIAVALDGSGCSDLDGDLAGISWYEGSVLLGTGTPLSHTFGLGTHTVTAYALDAAGKWDSADTTVTLTH